MTEFELFQALRPYYPSREYALLPQVADGTGAGRFRHCDALALSLWPSRGLHLSGFEMKSYRGDWLRELKAPEKAEEIARYCNLWWIVAAGPFVKPEEVPQPWGLMVWDEKKQALIKSKAAPFRKSVKPDLPFIAAILRKSQDVVTPAAALESVRKEAFEQGRQEGASGLKFDREEYQKVQKRIKEFEKASGITINGWVPAKEIGEAVHAVLNGSVQRGRAQLRSVAQGILRELGSEDSDAPPASAGSSGDGLAKASRPDGEA